jgi:hypothetical protein
MTDPVWPLIIFLGVGGLWALGVIAVIIIEATSE